jgi:hypothetical protein
MEQGSTRSSSAGRTEAEPTRIQPARASSAPWIAASIAGVVLVALALVYFLALRPAERDADAKRAAADKQAGQLTATEARAMDAAATEMLNLVSFRRAHFDADFQRAVDGATGALRSDVAKNRAATLKTMTNGKFDLYGRLTHKALEGPVDSGSKHGYVVLVTINGYRSTAPAAPVQQNLEVTVLDINGKWLASDVTNIGVTA